MQSSTPGRAAAARAAAGDPRARGVAAAARVAARPGRGLLERRARRAPRRLPVGRARRGRADRRLAADPGHRERERAGRRGPGAAVARRARPRAAARGRARRAAGRSRCTPPPPRPSRPGWARASSSDFVTRALFLDREDPAAAWGELRAFQAGADRAARARRARSTSRRPGTDLTLNVEGRTWINSDGKRNMPSGEVFTGAARDVRRGRDPLHDPDLAARRGRRGRDAGVPRRPRREREGRARRRLPAGHAGDRPRRPLPRRARHRHQLRHRPPDRRDPVRREDRRHRPPRARPLLSGDRRHERVRRALGPDLRPAPGRDAQRRRRGHPRRRPFT